MNLDKINVKQYNINKLKILPEMKTKIGYNSKIQYNNNNFLVQTPVCEVLENDYENNCTIKFNIQKNFSHFQFFYSLEQSILDFLEKSKYGSREKFISSLNRTEDGEMIMKIKLNSKCLYFNKNQDQIIKYDIKIGDKIIIVLETKGIWMDNISCTMKWNSYQILKLKGT